MSSHQFAYAQKRRSTRIEKAIPVLVQGVGAMREPYQEQVSTVSISCHGCVYQSKHEVIQGETVYLDIKPPKDGSAGLSSRARVKWAQKVGANKERVFQIAVELEIAGNVWGVAAPPPDWFPPQIPQAGEPAPSARELKVVSRSEQQALAAHEERLDRSARLEKRESAASSVPALSQLMLGLGEQIQTMASEAATSALSREKSRLLEEFRGQVREEAIKAIQSAIAASKEVIARQAMKEMSEAQEAAARSQYELWRKKVELDMETARQHLLTQFKEVNRRIDAKAAGAIERMQQNMENTRGEAVERFVSRLRGNVEPMLAEAKASIQKLEASEIALKKESESIYLGFENHLEFSANASLAKTQEALEKNTAAIAARSNDALGKLQQEFEKAARKNADALLASIGGQLTKALQEKAAEMSREFCAGIESYTRNYLESISKSIAEIPRNMPERPKTGPNS